MQFAPNDKRFGPEIPFFVHRDAQTVFPPCSPITAFLLGSLLSFWHFFL